MQKKDKSAERTARYRERLVAKKEVADAVASQAAEIRSLNLCSFAETGYNTPAQTCQDEIQIHRSWLRAFREIGMDAPDVLPGGETLRELARRTWQTLLRSEKFGSGVSISGDNVWYPLFSPRQQSFQTPFDSQRFPEGPFGERISGAAKPEWLEANWVAPEDCNPDEIISINLPSLPPMPEIKTKMPEPKRVKRPEPQAFDEIWTQARSVLPPEQFGTFGVTVT